MNFSKREYKDLFKAWIIISLAFAIVFVGLSFTVEFFIAMIISAITVGLGFLLHELAHKFVAQRYGCWAEFRSFDNMLILALVMSFFGFIFAAPGAVMIRARVTTEQNGKISAAGPLTNIVLGLVFLLFGFILPFPGAKLVAGWGVLVNAWLALFNLLPFFVFDGKKVFKWSRQVWLVLVLASIGLMYLNGIVF